MDSSAWWIWIGLVVIGMLVFVWLRSIQPFRNSEPLGFRKRILQWLQAVNEEELTHLQSQLESQRSELATRIDRLELSLTRQGRFEQWASEVNSRLAHIELSRVSGRAKGHSLPSHAKSFLCLGVRVTLTDRIWDELGMGRSAKLSDSEIGQFIQGPFCRNCLRSLAIQVSVGAEKSIRAQCRYCSLAWREESSSPLLLREFKREAFEYLDAAYRSKRIPEE
ncbi:MAG: hypothetical protein MRJ96_05210 [Nitrospirales bacterium]|nr:hypothetical protein [Nitrospira sp.]MDR4500834.1 hypothetical protein [Nitrospirales bacterium]